MLWITLIVDFADECPTALLVCQIVPLCETLGIGGLGGWIWNSSSSPNWSLILPNFVAIGQTVGAWIVPHVKFHPNAIGTFCNILQWSEHRSMRCVCKIWPTPQTDSFSRNYNSISTSSKQSSMYHSTHYRLLSVIFPQPISYLTHNTLTFCPTLTKLNLTTTKKNSTQTTIQTY